MVNLQHNRKTYIESTRLVELGLAGQMTFSSNSDGRMKARLCSVGSRAQKLAQDFS